MRRLALCLVFAASLAQAQFSDDARRLWGRPIQAGAPTDGYTLSWSVSQHMWLYAAPGSGATIAGDVTGTLAASTVAKINGITISGTPAAGQVIAATGAATAAWSNPIVSPATGYQPNQILAGCGVEYVSGLTFNVGACSYTINGVTYSSAATAKTLTAADVTNDRIDVIAVDTSGSVVVIDGVAASPPAAPTTDPGTQLGLTFVYVAAGATTPAGVTAGSIYEENTEWTSSVTANFAAASTSNPYRGTKDIEATTAALTNAVTLVKPAAGTETLTSWNSLVFYIRSKALWPSGNGGGASAARTLSIFWLSGATQVGQAVVLRDGQFGFASGTTTVYQQITIPTSLFGTGATTVTSLKFQVTGNGGTSTIGFYLDGISLQGGLNGTVLPAGLMTYKGAWSAATAYNTNDVVTDAGGAYIAVEASTGKLTSNATAWTPLANRRSFLCHVGNPLGTTTIATGDAGCYTKAGPYPGTIYAIGIIGNGTALAACSITLDVDKKNAAPPDNSTNKVSASAPITLSSATENHTGSVSTWSKPVAAYDVWNMTVATVTGCVFAEATVYYQ